MIQAGFTLLLSPAGRRKSRGCSGPQGRDAAGRLGRPRRLRSALRGCAVVHCVAGAVRECMAAQARTGSGRLCKRMFRDCSTCCVPPERWAPVASSSPARVSSATSRQRLDHEESPLPDPSVLDDTYVRTKAARMQLLRPLSRRRPFQVISIMPGVWSARETPGRVLWPIAPGLLERAVAGRHTRILSNRRRA